MTILCCSRWQTSVSKAVSIIAVDENGDVVELTATGTGLDVNISGGVSVEVPTTDTAYTTGSVSAGTTEALASANGSSNLASRNILYIENTDTSDTVFYGPTGLVADMTSASLEPGDFVFLAVGPNISVFLRTAAGTSVCAVQEFS